MILIYEDKIPRQRWKIGAVDNFVKSRDGLVRGATVRYYADGKFNKILRPVNKLYPVECSSKPSVSIQFVDEKDIIVAKQ